MVTHIGIINKGNLLFQGTLEQLTEKQQQSSFIKIESSHSEKVLQVIRNNNLNGHIENGKIILPLVSKEIIAAINKQMVSNDIEVYEITTVRNDLETIFMNLIKKQ